MCLLLMYGMAKIINGILTYRQWRVTNTVIVVVVFHRLVFSLRKIHLIISVLTDMLSLSYRAEHRSVRLPIILCCLSMSHAECPQIPFILHSSEAAMYSSASVRAEFELQSLF